MADASETPVTEQEVALEAAEKKEDLEKTNGGGEVILQKVEEPAPEGLAESSGDKAVKEVEGESKPEDVPRDVLAAETVVVAVTEVKTEEEAAVETILKVKQEDEPVKEVAANKLEDESIRIASEARILEEEAAEAVPEEVIKEPKEVAEAENAKQVEILSVIEDVSEKAVIKEAMKDKKEEGQVTEVTDPVKPGKKQSRNVILRMKRSFSKVKKAFAGKLRGSKTADVKAEENAE